MRWMVVMVGCFETCWEDTERESRGIFEVDGEN